jgi:hypothetical protein
MTSERARARARERASERERERERDREREREREREKEREREAEYLSGVVLDDERRMRDLFAQTSEEERQYLCWCSTFVPVKQVN